MTDSDCTVDSFVPLYITLGYLGLNLVFLFLCIVIKFFQLKEERLCKRIKKAFELGYKNRGCYWPAMVHIMDQATDFGVIYEYYLIWQNESNNNDIDCKGVNGLQFFILTISPLFISCNAIGTMPNFP